MIPTHHLEDLVFTNKLEGFVFSKKVFFIELNSFQGLQKHSYGRYYFAHKIYFILFFQVWYDYLIQI